MSRRVSVRRKHKSRMSSNEENNGAETVGKNVSSPIFLNMIPTTNQDGIPKAGPEGQGWKRFIRPILFITVFVIIGVMLIVFLYPKPDTVCYIRVGCFSVSGPWAERPTLANFSPQSPSVINTTFIVTSRQDPNGTHGKVTFPSLGHFGVVNEAEIPWNNSSLIIFLIHGYTDEAGTWMQTLKDAFLAQRENLIVVMVDWQCGAAGYYYPQVVANTRVVAREITLFIRYIQQRFGRTSPKRIHLVGHSLGSQISSYVGKSFLNSSRFSIYQITALDPAYPLFEGYSKEIRLHKNDARHVLAIHSNTGPVPYGLGMKDPVGTVDIYLNDGRDQRGCPRWGGIWKGQDTKQQVTQLKVDNKSLPKVLNTMSDIKNQLACSHRRAYDWLEDILRNLAGILFSYSTFPNASTVIAYPINWINDSDAITLTNDYHRSIEYSFCQEEGENGCWKLERNENDAFFQLPPANSSSSTFVIPTTDRSPFCARFALLEVATCLQYSAHINPLLGNRVDLVNDDNTTFTISQVAFEDEVIIYQGFTHHDKKQLQTWVTFPCADLQHPLCENDNRSNDLNNQNYLSVKLAVSLDHSLKNEQKTSVSDKTESVKRGNSLSICVNRMRLVFFSENEKEIVSLEWLSNKGDASASDEEIMTISSMECVEIRFPLPQSTSQEGLGLK